MDLIFTAIAVVAVVVIVGLACAMAWAMMQPPKPYRLYYVSQDLDGRWSVYSEDYYHRNDYEPILGTTERVITSVTEHEARDNAMLLQLQWDNFIP